MRAGGDGPKQYRPLAGRPVLARTLETFLAHPGVDAARVVRHADDADLYAAAVESLAAHPKLLAPAIGGKERQDSVRLGLESLEGLSPAIVLIHDAARPFVDAATISRVIDAARSAGGAIAALPVFDTILILNYI